MGRVDLAGAAHLQLVSGVVQLHPEDAMVEAMLGGWRAQQLARGLRETTIAPRERLVRQFLAFTREYPWQWAPAHVDEWTQSFDRRFIQDAVGHRCDTSTAIYTHVSGDFMNTALRNALAPALG